MLHLTMESDGTVVLHAIDPTAQDFSATSPHEPKPPVASVATPTESHKSKAIGRHIPGAGAVGIPVTKKLTWKKRVHRWLMDPWTVAWLISFAITFLFIRIVLWPRTPVVVKKKTPDPQLVENNAAPNLTSDQTSIPTPAPIDEAVSPAANLKAATDPMLVNLQPAPAMNSTATSNLEQPAPPAGSKPIDMVKTPPEPGPIPDPRQTPQSVATNPPIANQPGMNAPDVKPGGMKIIAIEDEKVVQNIPDFDLQKALALQISKFEQPKAVQARRLLVEIEPLTGVYVLIHPEDEAAMKIVQTTELQLPPLEKLTVNDLFTKIAERLDLELIVRTDAIYLKSHAFPLDKIPETQLPPAPVPAVEQPVLNPKPPKSLPEIQSPPPAS
jgi:hypothetical protein